ncbi:MAG: apolipoprotein N-acyltransferase, partial [Deltaproteobacteria bacterium]|nr:apolipoprotein N-acyltransferase [Deltaproteobacteria bacterium]
AGSELVATPPAGGESAPVRSLFPARVRLVGIQPDFSLKLLASNPEMSYSDRTMSLGTLLGDSTKALQQTPPGVNPIKGHVGGTLPTVVVWPESVYPLPFTDKGDWAPQAPVMANAVREWTALRRIHLVMASMEVAPSLDSQGRWNGWDYFGAAIHVSPDEKPLELYRKIFLIPFGETIPFGDWFPTYRALLKSWIPQISEFKSGTDYTVFNIAPGVTAAPLICFDATRPDITRGMVERGANLGVVMANLAWFGKTGASPQFAQYVRFRAMENRIPIFLVAQSGESVLINRLGREASPKLPLFEAGSVAAAVTLWPGGGFYTRYGFWVELGFLLGLGVALGVLLKPKMKHLRGG